MYRLKYLFLYPVGFTFADIRFSKFWAKIDLKTHPSPSVYGKLGQVRCRSFNASEGIQVRLQLLVARLARSRCGR